MYTPSFEKNTLRGVSTSDRAPINIAEDKISDIKVLFLIFCCVGVNVELVVFIFSFSLRI